MTNILQNSPQWLEIKQSRIGGSEIFSLANYYCSQELKDLKIDTAKEPPFRSALELFCKVKFSSQLSQIGSVNSEFGKGMEEYIANRVTEALADSVLVTRTDEFIVGDGLMCCSPDGYIEIEKGSELEDFDSKNKISSADGVGILESKTTNYFEGFKTEEGMKWGYIFQLQYNMLVSKKKWGLGAVLIPKDKEYDDPFFKGKIIERLSTFDFVFCKGVGECYDLYLYPYLAKPVLQELCLLALKRFQEALNNNRFPAFSNNLALVLRERKLLADIYPERFGELDVSENPDIDSFFGKIAENNAIVKETQIETEHIKGELIKFMGNRVGLIGSSYKAYFNGNGFTVRRINNK